MKRKKKPPYALYLCCYTVILFMVLQVVSVAKEGDTILDILRKYEAMVGRRFYEIRWNGAYSLKAIGIVTGCFLLYVLYDMTVNRNFLPGREYGNASWADIRSLNKRFEDRDEHNNRIYSENLKVSMDGMHTRINNNTLVIGGSGSGKSFNLLTPNIYRARADTLYPGSFIFTDPKGELLQRNGMFLKSKGYKIRVLNLTTEGMAESDCYNPFDYIRRESDIDKLITNLIANTTDKTSTKPDSFWERAEAMFLQALFLFVWMNGPDFHYEKNLNSVIDLLSLADVPSDLERQKKKKSKLDELFEKLDQSDKVKKRAGHHPAVIKYKKAMSGATDTVRSIVISANARMAIFENEQVRRLLSKDEMNLSSIGTGIVDNEKNEKTALFCVIPDADTTYNCIAGMLYTQLFQELYQIADKAENGGKLPVPVTFWLDEFPNIALPDNFTRLLATMRSRLISAVIIIQNLAQIKKLYEKDWEVITGNCDVLVYLGGNEASTHKYISENLGKTTIWKRSRGRNYGRNGSSSKNEDILGRELMTVSEVRELDNGKCIVFVRGQEPVLDDKYRTQDTEEYRYASSLGIYEHSREKRQAESLEVIDRQAYEEMKNSGRKVADIALQPGDIERALRGHELSEEELQTILNEQGERTDIAAPLQDAEKIIDISAMTLEQILFLPEFDLTDEEMEEVVTGMEHGLTDEQVKSYMLFGDVKQMRTKRRMLEVIRRNKKEKDNE